MPDYCVSAPGVEDVTDGSVDFYEMDWELCSCPCAEESSLPGEGCGSTVKTGCSRARAAARRCSGCTDCCGSAGEEDQSQTDYEAYEIVTE